MLPTCDAMLASCQEAFATCASAACLNTSDATNSTGADSALFEPSLVGCIGLSAFGGLLEVSSTMCLGATMATPAAHRVRGGGTRARTCAS
eukprot:7226888-Prymnesium_polylepis.1